MKWAAHSYCFELLSKTLNEFWLFYVLEKAMVKCLVTRTDWISKVLAIPVAESAKGLKMVDFHS